MDHLQYPIGRFTAKSDYTPEELATLFSSMQTSPARYRHLVESLPEADLSKTYRPGAWTIRQLVHHVSDIHLLNFLRIKKLLTEEDYVATMIDMNAWALTADATDAPVIDSLFMLEGINNRLMFLLASIDPQAYEKRYYHPVRKIHLNMKGALHMATWHLEHHLAHIHLALGVQTHAFSL
jgi:hypothetical protein